MIVLPKEAPRKRLRTLRLCKGADAILSEASNSASTYCRAKNVRILAVIIADLKLRDIGRHIFGAHLVERADDTALEGRPEILDRIGVTAPITYCLR
jgi:hypothetical protein